MSRRPDYGLIRWRRALRPSDYSIRKSPDQSVCATPRGLSQLTASFIVLRCQGIHRAPFRAWSCTSKSFVSKPRSRFSFKWPARDWRPPNFFRILDFLPLSKSYEKLCGTALRLRARTGRPPVLALPENGGRDRSRTCDLVLIRDAL